MTVVLKKGNRVDLTKGTGLRKAYLGLGWDINRFDSSKYDLDLTLFMCDTDYHCVDEEHFIFYGRPSDPENSVVYSGDNRTGDGDGDDESATVDFAAVSENVKSIVVAVTIYEAKEKDQSFGQVDNSYIRIVNSETDEELYRYELGEECSDKTAVVFAELYKLNGEWKFRTIGEGYEKDLGDLCKEYGIDVA